MAERGEGRAKLKELIDNLVAAGLPEQSAAESRVSELEAEIAELRELLRTGSVPASAAVPPRVAYVDNAVTNDADPPPPAPVPVPAPSKFQDTDSAGQLAYAERLRESMTRPRSAPWSDTYSTGRGIHNIPKNF